MNYAFLTTFQLINKNMEAVSKFKMIIKQMLLNFKVIFSNWINFILLTSLVVILLFVPMVFIPLKDSFGLTTVALATSSSMIIFSYLVSNFKKSTLNSNSGLTKSDRLIFNLATFANIYLIVFSLELLYLTLLQILGFSHLLIDKYAANGGVGYYKLYKIPFIYFAYQITISILIAYSLSYLITKITYNQKTFFIIIASLLILTIIFGGGFNNYFRHPLKLKDDEGHVIGSYPVFDGGNVKALFPTFLHYPTLLLFPFYSPSIMLSMVGETIRFKSYDAGSEIYWGDYSNYQFWTWATNDLYSKLNSSANTLKWNILWMFPYIQSSFMLMAAYIVSIYKNERS